MREILEKKRDLFDGVGVLWAFVASVLAVRESLVILLLKQNGMLLYEEELLIDHKSTI
jgi:hypothetical protein